MLFSQRKIIRSNLKVWNVHRDRYHTRNQYFIQNLLVGWTPQQTSQFKPKQNTGHEETTIAVRSTHIAGRIQFYRNIILTDNYCQSLKKMLAGRDLCLRAEGNISSSTKHGE